MSRYFRQTVNAIPPLVTFKKPYKEPIKAQKSVAAITQLVEWLAVNQHVTGSSPVGGAYGPVRSLPPERPAHNRAVMRSNRIRPTTIIALTFLLLYLFRRLRFVIRRPLSPEIIWQSIYGWKSEQPPWNVPCAAAAIVYIRHLDDPHDLPTRFLPCPGCRMRVLDKRAPLPGLEYAEPCSCGKRFIDDVFAHMYVIMLEEGDLTSRDPLIAVGSPLIHPGFAMDRPPFLPEKSLVLLSGKVQKKAARRIVAEVPEVRGVVKTADFVPGLVSHDAHAVPRVYTLLAGCDVRADIYPLATGPLVVYKQQSLIHVEFPRAGYPNSPVGCSPHGKTTGPFLCGCLLWTGDARAYSGVLWRAARGHERCLVCIGVLVGIQH